MRSIVVTIAVAVLACLLYSTQAVQAVSIEVQWQWYQYKHGGVYHYIVPLPHSKTMSLCVPKDGVHAGGECPFYFPNPQYEVPPWSY